MHGAAGYRFSQIQTYGAHIIFGWGLCRFRQQREDLLPNTVWKHRHCRSRLVANISPQHGAVRIAHSTWSSRKTKEEKNPQKIEPSQAERNHKTDGDDMQSATAMTSEFTFSRIRATPCRKQSGEGDGKVKGEEKRFILCSLVCDPTCHNKFAKFCKTPREHHHLHRRNEG